MKRTEYTDRWIEALLSGEYVQGYNCLRSVDNKWCCLGVGADITGIKWESPNMYNPHAYNLAGSHKTYLLSNAIREKLGLSQEEMGRLADMNDSMEKSFVDIAEYISESAK